MKKNVGKVDKGIRIVIGIIILGIGLINQSLWGLLGFFPIIIALLGNCPLYSALGLKTCPMHKKQHVVNFVQYFLFNVEKIKKIS